MTIFHCDTETNYDFYKLRVSCYSSYFRQQTVVEYYSSLEKVSSTRTDSSACTVTVTATVAVNTY